MEISFIGGGVMAEAIIAGILRQDVSQPREICVGEPLQARREHLAKQHGIAVTSDNVEAASHGELVVLSVKPQSLSEVAQQLTGALREDQTAISIIAGSKLETLVAGLAHRNVIRVMPNTPSRIGEGMSLWLASASVGESHKEAARTILQTLGEEMEVSDEKYLDMGTALSAGGPAYVFLFLESLIDAGVYMGMSRDMASKMALQTLLGSAKLAKESGEHPARLRDMVTSPGGTTAEALKVLEEKGFRDAVINAVVAAYEKAKRLGENG